MDFSSCVADAQRPAAIEFPTASPPHRGTDRRSLVRLVSRSELFETTISIRSASRVGRDPPRFPPDDSNRPGGPRPRVDCLRDARSPFGLISVISRDLRPGSRTKSLRPRGAAAKILAEFCIRQNTAGHGIGEGDVWYCPTAATHTTTRQTSLSFSTSTAGSCGNHHDSALSECAVHGTGLAEFEVATRFVVPPHCFARPSIPPISVRVPRRQRDRILSVGFKVLSGMVVAGCRS